jgi:hypothetical protein
VLDPEQRALTAGHDRQAGLTHELTGRDLVAEALDGLDRRSDEGEPQTIADLGQVGVLGEKAVARVNRIGAAHQRG